MINLNKNLCVIKKGDLKPNKKIYTWYTCARYFFEKVPSFSKIHAILNIAYLVHILKLKWFCLFIQHQLVCAICAFSSPKVLVLFPINPEICRILLWQLYWTQTLDDRPCINFHVHFLLYNCLVNSLNPWTFLSSNKPLYPAFPRAHHTSKVILIIVNFNNF